MVLEIKYYCEKCGERYTNVYNKWCKPCQINNLNWISGNEMIDNFIQKMQLEINDSWDEVFEWIPYDQFNDIEEIGRGDFAIVYSAIWKDGPLNYSESNKKYTRKSDKKVLKC